MKECGKTRRNREIHIEKVLRNSNMLNLLSWQNTQPPSSLLTESTWKIPTHYPPQLWYHHSPFPPSYAPCPQTSPRTWEKCKDSAWWSVESRKVENQWEVPRPLFLTSWNHPLEHHSCLPPWTWCSSFQPRTLPGHVPASRLYQYDLLPIFKMTFLPYEAAWLLLTEIAFYIKDMIQGNDLRHGCGFSKRMMMDINQQAILVGIN